MRLWGGRPSKIVIVDLGPGEDLYEAILEACRQSGLSDAVVVDGHATLDPVVIHDVTSIDYPIVENVRTLSGPHELTNIAGLVIDGQVHAHVTVATSDATHGGHLHLGTRVLYLAEIVLLGVDLDEPLTRRHEPKTERWTIRPTEPR
jgi:hypothetical protein